MPKSYVLGVPTKRHDNDGSRMVGDDYACGDCHDRHYGHDHHEIPLKDSVDCHLFSDGPGEGRGARALREGGEDMSSSSSSSSSSFCSIFYMHVYIACEFSILIWWLPKTSMP